MPEPQSFKNHARFDPPFHFIAAPILLINLIVTIVVCITTAIHHGTRHLPLHIWLVVVSFALVVVATNSRVKDLKVQDRLIRLEERLRYEKILSQADLIASDALTLPQIVALRFASDAELSALITRTLAENLKPKHIKQSIVSWRADNHRV